MLKISLNNKLLKKYIFSFIFGVGIIFAFPPLYFVFVAPVAIVGLSFFFLYSKSIKESIATGFLAGLGFGIAGFYWFFYPIFYVTGSVLIAVLAAIAGQLLVSIFFIAISYVSYFIPKKNIWLTVVLNASVWSFFESLRTYIPFGGFPWNLIATLWDADIYMLQIVAYIGVYGLGFMTYFLFSTILVLLSNRVSYKQKTISLIIIATIILACHLLGYHRLSVYNKMPQTANKVAVLQPSISQSDKSNKNSEINIFNNLVKITSIITKNNKNILVVWPETIIDFSEVYEKEMFLDQIKKSLFNNATLVTGVLRSEKDNRFYNSALVFNSNINLIKYYDKIHLVPFGEYIPLAKLLKLDNNTFISNFTFSSGQEKTIFNVNNNLLFRVLICFEAIFFNKELTKKNINFVVNIANDGWYGRSVEPYQHLSLVRLRAIEAGIPIIRAANSGISAIIDSTGKITQYLGVSEKGYLITKIPPRHKVRLNTVYIINNLVFTTNSVLLTLLLVNIVGRFFGDKRNKSKST